MNAQVKHKKSQSEISLKTFTGSPSLNLIGKILRIGKPKNVLKEKHSIRREIFSKKTNAIKRCMYGNSKS